MASSILSRRYIAPSVMAEEAAADDLWGSLPKVVPETEA